MAELPDLQVYSLNLNKGFAGKKLMEVKVINGKKLPDSGAKLKKCLNGKKLKNVYRSGKELRFDFADGTLLGMHLMLRGDVITFDKTNNHPWAIVEFYFEGGVGIALVDRMKSALVTLSPIDKKGVDAVSKDLNLSYLKKAFQTKRMIKDVLMDQDIIRGIGNTYSDEILWEARISPFALCNAIPDAKVKELARIIKSELKSVTKNIYNVYAGKENKEIKDFLKVHTRDRRTSPTGAEIKVEKHGSRKSYFTDEQVLYK